MSSFTTFDLPMADLKIIKRQRLGDDRGFLSRLFCAKELANVGWHKSIAQINHTFTAQKGTVRGLHFQKIPFAEMKLVTCLKGEAWDVVVDLRPSSPTFLNWHAEIISAENSRAIFIPEGFAHGFQALTDNVDLLYCHSAPYNECAESGLNVRDPYLAIKWPIGITEISIRDVGHPLIDAKFEGVKL